MKVLFKNFINGYTGNADDYVMYYNRRINRVIMREKPVYRHHPGQPPFTAVMANLKALNPSQSYRDDAVKYVELYNELPANNGKNLVTWSNLFQKIMWMMKRIMPELDLATLTRAQIFADDLPCISVKRAVEAGIIPKVKNYDVFDNVI